MRKILFSLLPIMFFATDALACSLMPNFDIIKKNQMVIAAINQVGQDLSDVKNLATKDYTFNFGYTFADPGFECHDTEEGKITVLFSSDNVSGMYASTYDANLNKQYEDLYAANDWDGLYKFETTIFKCDFEIKIEYSLKPVSATEYGYPMYDAVSGTAVCNK